MLKVVLKVLLSKKLAFRYVNQVVHGNWFCLTGAATCPYSPGLYFRFALFSTSSR